MNSWCGKTKLPAIVFPKPEPKHPTARNAAAVTGGGANAQAYEAERTTLTAQGGGSGRAVPAPNEFFDRGCDENLLSPDERMRRQRSRPLSVLVLLSLSVTSSAGLCPRAARSHGEQGATAHLRLSEAGALLPWRLPIQERAMTGTGRRAS